MALQDYQIGVISIQTGQLVHVYDQTSLIALRYSRVLNGVGTLALSLENSNNNLSAFRLDNIIDVRRTNPVSGNLETEDSYFSRMTQRYIENNEERLAVGGVHLNHLLLRRVIDPASDPLEAGGFSTKGGAADTVIRDYVREQAGDLANNSRSFDGFTVPAVPGTGAGAGARARYENLLETVQTLAHQGGVDFNIYRTTGKLLEMFIGVMGGDKTKTTNNLTAEWVGLDPNRGNLVSPSLLEDRQNEQNFVYVLSQGQGDGRQLLKMWGTGIADSPFNRVEYVLDARNIQRGDTLSMYTEGKGDLTKKRTQLKFTYKATGLEPGNVYKLDWDLGDKITVIWDETEQDVRVTGVEVTIDESGESIVTTVENII